MDTEPMLELHKPAGSIKKKPAPNWFLLACLLIIILAAFYWFYIVWSDKQAEMISNSNLESTNNLLPETGPAPIDLGQVTPEQIPTELVPTEETTANNNQLRAYEEVELVTSSFVSPKDALTNFEFYKQYLLRNKWQIINIASEAPVYLLYASKGKEEINITISELDEIDSATGSSSSQLIISLSEAKNN